MGCSVITGLGCKAEPRPELPGSPARIVPETEPMQKRWVSEYSSSAPASLCCFALEIYRYGFQLRAKGTQVGPLGSKVFCNNCVFTGPMWGATQRVCTRF
jgi:hypothetical protein